MTQPAELKDGLLGRGDEFYELLMRAHEGLDFDQSIALNARIILLMANEIGDINRLKDVINAATEHWKK
ncbi:MAG: DUF2783 domain-containing protein [Sneathiella sp.]